MTRSYSAVAVVMAREKPGLHFEQTVSGKEDSVDERKSHGIDEVAQSLGS